MFIFQLLIRLLLIEIILLLNQFSNINGFTFLTGQKAQEKVNHNQMIYTIPQEGSKVVFKCLDKTTQRQVQMWILPDGEQIAIIPSQMKLDENGTLAIWQRNNSIKLTPYEMLIPAVKANMDGRYTCVYAAEPTTVVLEQSNSDVDGIKTAISVDPATTDAAILIQRRSFFIPYVISNFAFSRSAILTISISVAFALIFCIVLLFDRYFRDRTKNTDTVEPVRMENGVCKSQMNTYPQHINRHNSNYGMYNLSDNSVNFDADYDDDNIEDYPDYSDRRTPETRRQSIAAVTPEIPRKILKPYEYDYMGVRRPSMPVIKSCYGETLPKLPPFGMGELRGLSGSSDIYITSSTPSTPQGLSRITIVDNFYDDNMTQVAQQSPLDSIILAPRQSDASAVGFSRPLMPIVFKTAHPLESIHPTTIPSPINTGSGLRRPSMPVVFEKESAIIPHLSNPGHVPSSESSMPRRPSMPVVYEAATVAQRAPNTGLSRPTFLSLKRPSIPVVLEKESSILDCHIPAAQRAQIELAPISSLPSPSYVPLPRRPSMPGVYKGEAVGPIQPIITQRTLSPSLLGSSALRRPSIPVVFEKEAAIMGAIPIAAAQGSSLGSENIPINSGGTMNPTIPIDKKPLTFYKHETIEEK